MKSNQKRFKKKKHKKQTEQTKQNVTHNKNKIINAQQRIQTTITKCKSTRRRITQNNVFSNIEYKI